MDWESGYSPSETAPALIPIVKCSATFQGFIVRHYTAILLVIALFPVVSIASEFSLGHEVFIKPGASGTINGVAAKPSWICSSYTVSDLNEDAVRLEGKWFRKSDVMSVDEALEFFNELVIEKPLNPLGWVCRAAVLAAKEKGADGIHDCDHAIELDPKCVGAYIKRGEIKFVQGAFDEALGDCNTAIQLDPQNAEAFLCRSAVWNFKADSAKAIKDCDEGIRLGADECYGYLLRAEYRIERFELNAAIEDCDEAIKRDAKCSKAFELRGNAEQLLGDITNAIEDYQKAIRLNPLNPTSYQLLAWVYATHPDQLIRNGTLAVELAKKACDITKYEDCECVRTLAAAYAESADYTNAATWQDKAVELASADNKAAEQAWAQYYRSERPCREFARTDPMMGASVFLRDGASATLDDEIVDPALMPFRLTVSDFDDTELWVGRAWVKRVDVMSVDEG
jgi:tetratricopeptide (TPR) repeat protein